MSAKKMFILVTLFCLAAMPVLGFELDSSNPRLLALGSGAIALTGIDLGGDNPAGLAQSTSRLSFYYNNFYGFQGNDIKGGKLTLQTKLGTLALAYDAEGFSLLEERNGSDYESLWDEKKLAFGYAATMKKVNLGFSILQAKKNVYSDYEEEVLMQKSNLLMNWGLQINGERLGLGFALKNLGQDREPLFGLGLRLGKPDNLVGIVDLCQGQEKELIVSGGLEAWVRDNFALRIGLDRAGMVTVGLGASAGRIKVDYAYRIHPVGNTHYVATSYLF